MRAHVRAIRERDPIDGCPSCKAQDNPRRGEVGVFCEQHSTVIGFRWAVQTASGVKTGEAKTRKMAWAAVERAAA